MPRPPLSTAAAVALSVLGAGQQLLSAQPVLELGAVLLGTAAVAIRQPLAVAGAVAGSVAVQAVWADSQPVFASFLALLAAAYGLGRELGARQVAAGLLLLAAGIGAMIAVDPSLRTPAEVVVPAIYLTAAVGVGRIALARQAAAAAAVVAERDAARERERIALLEQRSEIAREMHDVVAHSLSLVVVQAEAAAAVADSDPARSRQLVEEVAATGRQALVEMRRSLGVLRAPADHGPQPGLAELEPLAAAVRRTGAEVVLTVDDAARAIKDPGVQLAAYRVVQEALTNAVRHGAAQRVDVRVQRTATGVEVHVQDDGTAAEPTGSGHGLAGMRERVRAYGGSLTAGPHPGGGWRVHAQLSL